jgi:REP element-mobilizing transposase RayT
MYVEAGLQARRVFVDDDPVRLVMTDLSRTAEHYGFSVVAYCLMPDHAHMLLARVVVLSTGLRRT